MLARYLAVEHSFTKNTTAADVEYWVKNSAKYYFSPLRCKVIAKHAKHVANAIQQFFAAAQQHNDEQRIAWATWGE